MKRFFLLVSCFALSNFVLFAKKSDKVKHTSISKTASILLNDVVSRDTFYVQTSDCNGTGDVCIDIPFMDSGNYSFTDNGNTYTGNIQGCMELNTFTYDYGQLFGQGSLGPYMIDSCVIDGATFSGSFMTIPDLVDSMNLWNPAGNWVLDNIAQTITGGNPTSTYSTMDITVTMISAPSSIPVSTTSSFGGSTLNLAVGTHWVQVLESGGGMCLDSFFVQVICVQTVNENFTVEENTVQNYCFDNSELLGLPTSVEILCPDNPGTPVDFNLINGNSCVEISAISLGQDTACFVICDNLGICDTTHIYVNVVPPVFNGTTTWLTETIYLNSTQQICIDTSEMAGLVLGISNGCPDQSGEYASFSIDANTYCVDLTGIDIGKDTACIEVIDNYGNVDTTYIVACVAGPSPDTIFQSIFLGDSVQYCIDTTQLGGVVTSIINLCDSGPSGVASFVLDSATFCYQAMGNTVGQGIACIQVCDNFGTCDTTLLQLEIAEGQVGDLVAVDDETSVLFNEQLAFNICDNDTIPNGFLTNYFILPTSFGGVGPNLGTVSFDSECNIIYVPTGQDCGLQDQFNYVICNQGGCDTALVTVDILCEPTNGLVEIPNGFSPNGDDVNEFFTIKGVENLQNNTLTIYNRWGNQVFKTENYQNDWNGTWDGANLQNGTYFYLFNDGAGNTYSGYVYLQR